MSKPIQYTKGYVEFYKLKFKVTPDVLIPRPETELLVDEVLKYIKYYVSSIKGKTNPKFVILDVGTGAGNIAISLACNLGSCNVKIIATDVSEKALKVAKQNARLHGVEEKIKFVQSYLLNVIASGAKQSSTVADCRVDRRLPPRNDVMRADIIVTNLPYIPSARIPYLDSSVKDFEPHIALDGGEDGFGLYRELFQQIAKFSLQPERARIGQQGRKSKLIIGEIDYTHGELAVNEAQKFFPEAQIEVKKDLTHLQRILIIKLQ